MRSQKQEIASARNWYKFIISGAAANLKSPEYKNHIDDDVEILTEMEKERIEEAHVQLMSLVETWDKGTEKVMDQYT